MNLKRSKGFHFSLLVRGGADVCPRIVMGDPWNSQHVGLLETFRRKLSLHLDAEIDTPTHQQELLIKTNFALFQFVDI